MIREMGVIRRVMLIVLSVATLWAWAHYFTGDPAPTPEPVPAADQGATP